MKQITAVYNIRHHASIYTGTSVSDHKSHDVNLENPTELRLFKFVVKYLHRETIRGNGFFSCTSGGWHWLRYLSKTGATR